MSGLTLSITPSTIIRTQSQNANNGKMNGEKVQNVTRDLGKGRGGDKNLFSMFARVGLVNSHAIIQFSYCLYVNSRMNFAEGERTCDCCTSIVENVTTDKTDQTNSATGPKERAPSLVNHCPSSSFPPVHYTITAEQIKTDYCCEHLIMYRTNGMCLQ